ncbi:MAG: hypothetical protein F4092_15320 [Rhodospirillaceae bacterium]|nr:hypothetical protein [Rhodospirillaceae bacterium]
MRVGTGIGRARPGIFTTLAGALLATIAVTASATEAVAQTQAQRLKLLEQTVKELLARDEARERKMKAMEAELKRLRRGRGLATVAPKDKPASDDDHGHDHAKKPDAGKEEMAGGKKDEHGHEHDHKPGEDADMHADEHAAEVWSARVGDGVLRLKRLGLDVDFAMGGSMAKPEDMEALFGGHHDPKRTGFTLQGVDLSAAGSYDPYFDAFFNATVTVDGGGETAIELEEAWARSKWLGGVMRFQGGQFYAPFGIVNRTHIHDWAWQTRPIAATRVFGADGARGLGVQAEARLASQGSFRSSLLVSMQNRRSIHIHGHGEEEDAHAHEEEGTRGFGFTIRMANQVKVSPQTSFAFGGSAMFEPNPDGSEGQVSIVGADVSISHRLPSNNRLELTAEYLHRTSKATVAEHHDEEEEEEEGHEGEEEEHDERIRVRDYGFYVQGLWITPGGFGLGMRYEQVNSRGGEADEREADPMRGNRYRISPLLLWQFSELGKLKLQYNYDHATFLQKNSVAHSVFLSASWSFGLGAPDHAGHAH